MRNNVSPPNIAQFITLLQHEEILVRLKLNKKTVENFSFSKKHLKYEEKMRKVVGNYGFFAIYKYFDCLDKFMSCKYR